MGNPLRPRQLESTANPFANGSILESRTLAITSDGATITATVSATVGTELTFRFSDGVTTVDYTTPKTVTLTAGSDTVPQENFIYVLKTDPTTLVVNTSSFPVVEYAPIGRVIVQSATKVQAGTGVKKQQDYTDHTEDSVNQGHITHVNSWIREQFATWLSGVAPTITGSGTGTVTYAVTSGIVKQLHDQAFPAITDPATVTVINDFTTPFKDITNIGAGILTDSTGASLTGKHYVLVVWEAIAETGSGESKIYFNLPSGSYNTQSQAEDDADMTANFSIPVAYKGVGFLGQKIVMQNAADTTFTVNSTIDLRGQFPNTVAGTSIAQATQFPDSTFEVFNNADNTKIIALDASLITTATTRTYTAPDSNGTLALLNVALASEIVNDSTVTGADVKEALDDLQQQIVPQLEPVLDFVNFVTSEPAAPTVGDRYINTATGVSSITAQSVTANNIYEWNGTNWTETVPVAGDRIFDIASSDYFIFSGSVWIVDHETLNQSNYFVAAQAGNDTNSGLNDSDPVLTVGQLASLALAQIPSSSNPFFLKLQDGGVYDLLTTAVTVPSWCFIVGQAATVTAGAGGALNFSDNSGMLIGKVSKNGAGYIIQKTAGSGSASVHVLDPVDTGAFGFINLDNGNLHVKFTRAISTGATNTTQIQVVGGSLYLEGDFLNSTAGTGFTIRASGSSKVFANVDSINATDVWLELAGTATGFINGKESTGGLTLGGSTIYDIDVGPTRVRSSAINVQTAAGDYTITPGGNFAVTGDSVFTGDNLVKGANHGLGSVDGYIVNHNTSTSVTITAGSIEANEKLYLLASDASHSMTSLASAFDFHYIYIDDSASTAPTAVFIDVTTEPTFSVTKRGWYNGDDRCIGAVASTDGASTIIYFESHAESSNLVLTELPNVRLPNMASSMNPGTAWQTPNNNDGSVVTPVNAKRIRFNIANTDTSANLALRIANAEMASAETAPGNNGGVWVGFDQLQETSTISLGSSRNVRINGNDNDDNNMGLTCLGYSYQR